MSENNGVLVNHVRIHWPFWSISYHKLVLNNIQNEKILLNKQVMGLRKSLNYRY